MRRYTTLAVIAAILITASNVSAGSLIAPGYTSTDTPIDVPADGWFGGFDFLPNGNLMISDGYEVREITRQGEPVRTLYAYPDPDPSTPDIVEATFGSFVRFCPLNNQVYIGESTFGAVRSIPLGGGGDTLLATLPYNYDLDLWNGTPYVAAGNKIYRLGEGGQPADAVATAPGASGPVILDASGNLIYGTGDYDWSTPNDQNIYLWSAAQVAAAGGGSILDAGSAALVAANVNGPGGFAFGPSGELLYTDSIGWPASIRTIKDGVSYPFADVYVPDQFPWTTTLRSDPITGDIAAAVSWSVKIDNKWVTSTVISTLTPLPLPEPSSALALFSLIGLAASSRLLRRGR